MSFFTQSSNASNVNSRLCSNQISYTYGTIVATLTIIETPTATVIQISEPESDDDEKEEGLLTPDSDGSSTLSFKEKKSLDKSAPASPADPELLLIKSKPITATIRSTMKHLRAQAGRGSYFRGIVPVLVYGMLHHVTDSLLPRLSFGLIAGPLAYVVGSVLLGGLEMAWTHIVISAPSRQAWWRRIPSVNRIKVIAIPTAILAIAEQISLIIPSQLLQDDGIMSLTHPAWMDDETLKVNEVVLAKLTGALLATLLIFVFVSVPATVILRRVQASMLPDEDEAIVPFDRTFGGKVQSAAAGGSGAVSMRDAWKTFDWSARIRYFKLQGKVMALSCATTVLFAFIVAAEVSGFVGRENIKVLLKGGEVPGLT